MKESKIAAIMSLLTLAILGAVKSWLVLGMLAICAAVGLVWLSIGKMTRRSSRAIIALAMICVVALTWYRLGRMSKAELLAAKEYFIAAYAPQLDVDRVQARYDDQRYYADILTESHATNSAGTISRDIERGLGYSVDLTNDTIYCNHVRASLDIPDFAMLPIGAALIGAVVALFVIPVPQLKKKKRHIHGAHKTHLSKVLP